MSDLRRGHWPDLAFKAILLLLVGLWMVFPPQQIDSGAGSAAAPAAASVSPALAASRSQP
jgi:hypothetical protein